MVIDILKEHFNTDDTHTAMVRAWSRDFTDMASLMCGLHSVALTSTSGMRIASMDSVRFTFKEDRFRETNVVDHRPCGFSQKDTELAFSYRFSENDGAPHRIEYDRLRNSLDRQVDNIETAFQWIFGSYVLVHGNASYPNKIKIRVRFNKTSFNQEECTKLFPSMEQYRDQYNEYEGRFETFNELKVLASVELQADEHSNYSCMGIATEHLRCEVEAKHEQIKQLNDEISTIRKTMNLLMDSKKKAAEVVAQSKVENEGYDDRWALLGHIVNSRRKHVLNDIRNAYLSCKPNPNEVTEEELIEGEPNE